MKLWKTLITFSFLVVAFSFGCGSSSETGENYGDIFNSPSGLNLTATNHKYGWQNAQCNACHDFMNIHLVDRSGNNFDMQAIQNLTFEQGISVCANCHGTNGL